MTAVTETSAAIQATPDLPPAGDETRRRLVAAAAEVFAEKGYEGAGVQEIARRAGLTTGAIYSRYEGKAELLAEAIRGETGRQLDELFAARETSVSASELIRAAGSHLVARRDRSNDGLLLEAFVAGRRDPEVAAVLREHLAAVRGTFTRLIDFGRGRGDIDPTLETEAVAHFCQAVALGFLLYEAIDGPEPEATAWTDLIDRLVEAMAPAAGEPPG